MEKIIRKGSDKETSEVDLKYLRKLCASAYFPHPFGGDFRIFF